MSVPRLIAAACFAVAPCCCAPAPADDGPPPLGLSAELRPVGSDEAVLTVTVTPPDGFYVYSLRGKGGFATELRVTEAAGLEPLGDRFTPDRPPRVKPDPFTAEPRETFTGPVRWSRRYRVTDRERAAVAGTLAGQYCSTGEGGVCVGIRPVMEFTAAPDPGDDWSGAGERRGVFQFDVRPETGGQSGPAAVSVTLSPPDAKPGEAVTAAVRIDLDEGWHVYSTTQPQNQPAVAAKIEVEALRGLEPVDPHFTPLTPPETVRKDLGPEQTAVLEEYHDAATWTRRFTVTGAGADGYGLRGGFTYQTCNAASCKAPRTVEFALGRVAGAKEFADTPPPPTPFDMALAAAGPPEVELVEDFTAARPARLSDLWANLPLAFVAGLLLNVMPCVLPVIAIKVLGFVKQAGEDRRTVALLNLSYVAGVMAVFGAFALLSLGLSSFLGLGDRFGFGDQFNSPPVRVAMTCVIFALGLCLLGVYEIPLPGFLGTAAGGSPREGMFGAFTGGVFTTLLATPCTGPYMIGVLGYAAKIAAVSWLASVSVWLSMGLGFAAPYLLFALTPAAVKVLPKPGNWMVRFKEFGGLVMMGFALFLLDALDPGWWLPVLVTLLGIAFALWMVGSLYQHNAAPRRKWTVRGLAVATLALAVVIGWEVIGPVRTARAVGEEVAGAAHDELPWEPFSEERLRELRRGGRTVLIDFTSATCINCKVNEAQALNTAATRELVERYDVVPMQAWIDRSEEAYDWMRRLDAYGVPLTAIFRGDAPNEAPIRLGGVYTEATLHEKLREAVGAGDSDGVRRTAGL